MQSVGKVLIKTTANVITSISSVHYIFVTSSSTEYLLTLRDVRLLLLWERDRIIQHRAPSRFHIPYSFSLLGDGR